MEKLSTRKKPMTDVKWNAIIDNRLGIDYTYTWNPVHEEFNLFYNADFCLADNTIILFFPHNRIGIRLGESEFSGKDPIFPQSLLKKYVKIKYRCSITDQIRYGAKLITTELPIESFMIPKDGEYLCLLKALAN